ncbi:hypothetical protein IFM89_008133 [Coptis chinensis]|uniref:Aspartate/glutamate/uridylate kinase domain-containing protein n=1 Tax=Coptis chinensis TaxID=261450 RepID=A0A835IUR4_9MAGN|nr:hypothetical protein IFM89_008133 [Coptis chinensis]
MGKHRAALMSLRIKSLDEYKWYKEDLVLLSCVGIRPVLVHGGGPEINIWLNKVNIQPHFLNGLHVTDAATMEIVQMVLVGKVNKGLVSLINKAVRVGWSSLE